MSILKLNHTVIILNVIIIIIISVVVSLSQPVYSTVPSIPIFLCYKPSQIFSVTLNSTIRSTSRTILQLRIFLYNPVLLKVVLGSFYIYIYILIINEKFLFILKSLLPKELKKRRITVKNLIT